MVNDAHVSVAIQSHVTSEGEISLLVHRQIPGSSSPDISLRSAGSAVSRCLALISPSSICPGEISFAISALCGCGLKSFSLHCD